MTYTWLGGTRRARLRCVWRLYRMRILPWHTCLGLAFWALYYRGGR